MPPKAALFIPCLTAELEPETGLHMADLVERAGFEVHVPEGQTCCGQPWFNTGYRKETLAFASRFLEIFDAAACDCIVSPSGSCVSMVRKHYKELDLAPANRQRLERVGPRLLEFTEFMALHGSGLRFKPGGPRKVYYHPSCHLTRELGVKAAPLDLLNRIEGLTVTTDTEPLCCGFGGTFSVKMPELSAAMTARKVEQVQSEHNPDLWVIPDASCLLQIHGWMRAHGVATPVFHLVDFLHANL